MTLRFHLTLSEWLSSRTQTTTNAGNDAGEKRILIYYWQQSKLVQSLWKSVLRLLKKLKIELPYDPAIPLLSIYSNKSMSTYMNTCMLMFIVVLFTIPMQWNHTRSPLRDKWIKKMLYIYTVECYSAIKKNYLQESRWNWRSSGWMRWAKIR
jgi:hypothetical protein